MSYLTEKISNELSLQFPELTFQYHEESIGGIIPSFFIEISSEEYLRSKWRAISECIAICFQSSLKNEFSIWNLCLFFILKNEITDELKYQIENDTFSSRKIVIAPKQEIEAIIREHILNSDLNINSKVVAQEAPFNSDKIIWEYLSKIPPKTRVTDEISTSLDLIIEKIKSQKL